MTNPRPQARSSRTESVLREIESGSVSHIKRLGGPTGWPTDHRDGALALKVLFAVLENEIMPSSNPAVNLSPHRSEATIQRVRAVLNVLTGPPILAMQKKDVKNVFLLSQVYQNNVPTLCRWLDFICRESRWVYSDLQRPETAGPILAVDTLHSFQGIHFDILRMAICACPACIDLVLYLWNWRDPRKQSLSYGYYRELGQCPLVLLITHVTEVPGVVLTLKEKFSSLPIQYHLRFIKSSIRHLEEWASLEGQTDLQASHTSALQTITMTQKFLDITAYAEAYIIAEYPMNVLTIATHLPSFNAKPKVGSEDVPFPVIVSTKFFPPVPGVTTARLVHKTLPGLLDAGLFKILVGHLLSEPEDTSQALEEEDDRRQPIAVLAMMCVDSAICQKTAAAIENIPSSHAMCVTRGSYAKCWMAFWKTFQIFYGMWAPSDPFVVL